MIGPAGASTVLPELVSSGGNELGSDALGKAAATAAALGPHLRPVVDAVVVTADGSLRLRLAAGFSATLGDDSSSRPRRRSGVVGVGGGRGRHGAIGRPHGPGEPHGDARSGRGDDGPDPVAGVVIGMRKRHAVPAPPLLDGPAISR